MDTLVNLASQAVDYLTKPQTLALIGAIIAASGIQQVVKAKVNNEARTLSERTNLMISIALSTVVVALDAYMSQLQTSPGALTTHAAAVLGLMQIAYRLAVKPVSAYLQGVLDDARAFREINSTSTQSTSVGEELSV